ncbi:MAG TPA: DUF933 domain-containing protein [Thermodesulfobacteriota bacterium]|nr:DUF933 domain-containing protein [Thermodesulfobacteriota bacterium]
MKVGLIGLPRAGKTTVFRALTSAPAAEESRTAERPGRGAAGRRGELRVIKVPDPRVDALAAVFRPRKTTHAEIAFADLPGPAEGEELFADPATADLVKGCDALALVVRAFDAPEVPHPRGSVDPARDLATVETEMALLDLMAVERRAARLAKERRVQAVEAEAIGKAKAWLEAERPLRTLALSEAERKALAGFRFLSEKPLLVVANLGDTGEAGLAALEAEAARRALPVVALRGRIEMEVAALPPEEQAAFLASFGLTEPARDQFIRAAYALADLVTFLTGGDDEVRAWPIRRGTAAQQAAGKIHSDMARGFIRAEVIPFEEFMALPQRTFAKAREAGKLRLEGKDYVVQDGDIIIFRFAV